MTETVPPLETDALWHFIDRAERGVTTPQEARMLRRGVRVVVDRAQRAEARVAELEAERDQYRAAARHLSLVIRQTACTWMTALPETICTADVYAVLMSIASHVPDRPELRDDLWMRIVGAVEARLEDDGHPEDARVAADEAMSVVQPELERRDAEREQLLALVRDLLHPGPCHLDARGRCEAHFWYEDGVACPHARAAELLAGPGVEE